MSSPLTSSYRAGRARPRVIALSFRTSEARRHDSRISEFDIRSIGRAEARHDFRGNEPWSGRHRRIAAIRERLQGSVVAGRVLRTPIRAAASRVTGAGIPPYQNQMMRPDTA